MTEVSFVRFLLYTSDIDLRGIIATKFNLGKKTDMDLSGSMKRLIYMAKFGITYCIISQAIQQ